MTDKDQGGEDMKGLIIYSTAGIAQQLLDIGDRAGANALAVLIHTLGGMPTLSVMAGSDTKGSTDAG